MTHMADFYPYLIASLPMVHFGTRPPFSFERFLEKCRPFVPEKDFQLVSTLPRPDDCGEITPRHPAVRRWVEFDTALRNELVRIRATKKGIGPSAWQRPGGYSDGSLASAVVAATISPSVIDAERSLDELRWKALEHIATGHYLDLDFLITYAFQLLILERWEKIRRAEGSVLLERALQK